MRSCGSRDSAKCNDLCLEDFCGDCLGIGGRESRRVRVGDSGGGHVRIRNNGRRRGDVAALCARHGDGDGLWSVATALIAHLGCDVPAVCRWCIRLAGLRSCGGCVSHRKSSGLRGVTHLADIDVGSCVHRGDGVRLWVLSAVSGRGCRGRVDRSRGSELRKI